MKLFIDSNYSFVNYVRNKLFINHYRMIPEIYAFVIHMLSSPNCVIVYFIIRFTGC